MSTIAGFARISAMMGDPSRAAMLWALMDGRALAAGELARVGGIANSTASEHLAALHDAGLVIRVPSGRHRYYRIASPAVATVLENVMSLTTTGGTPGNGNGPDIACGPRDPALRRLRTCYDHLAGKIAVMLADVLVARGHLEIGEDGASLTTSGAAFLPTFGVELPRQPTSLTDGAAFFRCRPCLDWSERRHHIGGPVGRQIYRAMLRNHWLRPGAKDRALDITPRGVLALEERFAIRVGQSGVTITES